MLITVGAVGLGITSFLHLKLGLPPLERGIEMGQIAKVPGMAPSELVGVWVGFSVLLFTIVVCVLSHVLRNEEIDRVLIALVGLGAIVSGGIILKYYGAFHIAFPLLTIPGALLFVGGLMFHKPKSGISA